MKIKILGRRNIFVIWETIKRSRWQATVSATNDGTTQGPPVNGANNTGGRNTGPKTPQVSRNYSQQPGSQPNREYTIHQYPEREQGAGQGQAQNTKRPHYGLNYNRGYNSNAGRPYNQGYPQYRGNGNRGYQGNIYQWRGNQPGNAPFYRGQQHNGQNPQAYQYNQHPHNYQYYQQRGGPQKQQRGHPQRDYQYQGGPPPYRGPPQGEGYNYSSKPQ